MILVDTGPLVGLFEGTSPLTVSSGATTTTPSRWSLEPLTQTGLCLPGIVAAYVSGGYTLQDIVDYFGLHYSRISKIVRAAGQASTKAKGKT
jgi:hypothetical protein